jgi:hypothetical protein
MSHTKVASAALCGALLAGCAASSFQELRPIEEKRILEVIGEIKRQIGVYVQYQNSPDGYEAVRRESRQKICGNGLVGFDISSVRMELLSTADSTVGGTIGGGYGPFSGGLGLSGTVSNSQALIVDYGISRSRLNTAFNDEDLKTAPIAALMKNLWGAARASGDQQTYVCLTMKPVSQGGNTYKIAITTSIKATGEVEVGLANVSAGASGEFKSSTGNTITVTLVPHTFPGAPGGGGQHLRALGSNPGRGATGARTCRAGDTGCANIHGKPRGETE